MEEADIANLSVDDKLLLLLKQFQTFGDKLTDIGTRTTTAEGTLEQHSQSIKRIDGNLVGDANRLANLETSKVEQAKEIKELTESVAFLSQEYETFKLKIAELEGVKTENVHLKKRIDDLENALLNEKIGRNDEQQYLRQSYNIKICNIPTVTGEDVQTKSATNPITLEVVKQLARQTDMLLPPTAVDVCHRLGSDPGSPIIIRFRSKSDRYNCSEREAT